MHRGRFTSNHIISWPYCRKVQYKHAWHNAMYFCTVLQEAKIVSKTNDDKNKFLTSPINDVTLYFHRAYLFVSQRNNMDNKVIFSANCVLYDTDLHTETRTIRGVQRGVLCSRCLKVFGFCTVGSAPFPLHCPPSIRELFSIRARPVTVTPQTSARSTHNIAQSMCARARPCKRSPN